MTALTDAIERLRADVVRDDDGKLIWDVTEDQALIYEVARRVADAPEVWWCEEHSAATHPPGPELRCDVWVVAGCEDFLLAEPCRMVRRLLVDPGDKG